MKLKSASRESCSKRIIVFFCVWILSLLGGISLLAWYSNKPGETGSPPKSLPKTIPLSNNEKQYQLFMFVHPKCSCTISSIRELKRFLANCSESVSCTFFCFNPSGGASGWTRTRIWNCLAEIPDSKIIPDENAKWAQSLGIRTSGHVLIYDSNHNLKFSGGITVGRGHEGESLASISMSNLVRMQEQDRCQYPVFGCPIIK